MRQQSSININLYHKQEHQPCTNLCHNECINHAPKKVINMYHESSASKHVPMLYQSCVNYSSTMTRHVCTNIINYCLNHVLNMYLNQKPSSISSSKYDLYLCNIPGVYLITFLQTFLNNSKTSIFIKLVL
jgi:hypothetical protein